jgi:hypothetical protein
LWSYWFVKITNVKEQQICFKFYFKLDKMAVGAHKMLKEVFGDNVLCLTQSNEWLHLSKGD